MRHTRALVAALAALPFALVVASCTPAQVTITPSDDDTVADDAQRTGRRVDLPLPDCSARPSDCNEIRLLNQLDGFDLDPRISLGFSGNVDLAQVTDASVYVQPAGGGTKIGLNRLVWDDASNTLYGQPKTILVESTTYKVVVSGVNGQSGESTFTTMNATLPLRQMRAQLANGAAYADPDAAIPSGERGLLLGSAGGQPTTFPAATVLRPRRFNDVQVGSGDTLMEEPVFNSAQSLPADAGTYAFGSFLAPSWLDADRKIPQVATGGAGPGVRGKERVGFVAVLPLATPSRPKPTGGWPVAIFGPGVTRSKYDVFLASDELLKQGIATIAIDPVGHAYGPDSEAGVDVFPSGTLRFDGFGRAVDVEGDGAYGARDGLGTKGQPAAYASIALRDGLRQTALDNMALALAIGRGADLDGSAGVDLRTTGITYFAQSLGGIYGTMLMGTDPGITTGVLNVPGGPILDIARLAPGFRPEVATELGRRQPSLLNGGDDGFTESQPLYPHRPQRFPAPGALEIQAVGARTNWLNRPGSPEAYAPLLRLRPASGVPTKKVLYQFAFGDATVPNPTSATIMRAGALQDVTTYYRNDRTVTATTDPHGFLLDPRITGRQMGQMQVAAFLKDESGNITDPDGAATVFEVPITDPDTLEACNFNGAAGLERCRSPK
ncbi:hypothetical protein BH18ACT1_BH18ACT1_09030 [soil metagenome]